MHIGEYMRKIHIVYSLLVVTLLLVLEGSFELTYIPKQIARIGLFFIGPTLIIYFVDKSTLLKEFKLGKPTFQEMKIALISSVVIFIGTFGGYYVLRFMFDPKTTIDGLEAIGVTVYNVLYWGLYMSIINSLVEEFFFRGFFYNSLKTNKTKYAVIYSGALFSIYHGLLFYSIFAWYTVIFTLFGLFLVGVFLAYINRFGKGFMNSYSIHIFANIACVLVLLHMYAQL